MTLGDPLPPQTTPFSTYVILQRLSYLGTHLEARHFKFGG